MFGKILEQLGAYTLMLRRMLYPPENWRLFIKRIISSCYFVGIQTLWLVIIISFFLGMIAVTMCEYLVDNPMVPHFVIGMITRELLILELTPTGITALIACVAGFRMTFQIGSLKMNEQMDALETMGINTASFIVFPFIIASIIMIPFLLIVSLFVSLFGGFLLCYGTNIIPWNDYLTGLQFQMTNTSIEMFFVKIYVFAFVVSSVAAFLGYSFSGTVRQLSKKSTYSITLNCILLLLLDYGITDLILYN